MQGKEQRARPRYHPDWSVESTTKSKRGRYRFQIFENGQPRAMCPVSTAYPTEDEAVSVGDRLLHEQWQHGYNEGRKAGKSAGYDEGVRAGKSVGYDEGVRAGMRDGERGGLSKGRAEGYANGRQSLRTIIPALICGAFITFIACILILSLIHI